MGDTYSKKENDKKKLQKLKEKALRREERKHNNNKGKSLDDMLVYVDANGQITNTPPDLSEKVEISLEDIQLGAAPHDVDETFNKGTVTFYNEEKGYGFINDHRPKESIFVHANQLSEVLKKDDKVSYEKEKGSKGYIAINVIKIK